MRPKRLISLLVAACMMITMLPLSAVTAFAEDTSSSTKYGTAIVDGYKYEYKVNEADNTATITKFLGPDGSAKSTGSYDITIPEKLDDHPVTGLGDYSFATEENGSPLYDIHHHNIHSVTIPESVTSIGQSAFESCFSLDSLIIKDAATSIGASAFDGCSHLTTLSLGKNITTIGDYAFQGCSYLTNVTIPESVTSIGRQAFYLTDLNTLTIKGPIKSMGYAAFAGCTNLTSLSLYDGIQTIGEGAFINSTSLEAVTIPQSVTSIGASAFVNCSNLSTITIPEKVTTIESNTFNGCSHLESIMLPAGLTSFQDRLEDCPAGNPNGAIYYKNYKAAADALLADNDANSNIDANDKLRKRNFLYLCKVTFDANGGTLTDKGGNPTDHAVVSAYKTKKINADDLKAIPNPTRAGYNFTGWYTKDGTFLNVNEITTKDMTEDITFYAHWAPVYHPLTVTGGTATVEKDGQPLNIVPVVTGDKKTYSVPEGAEVTVTLDKTAVPNGKVFDGWSTSLPTGQDCKAESITFPMSSGVNVSAKYRDAATDHTPGTAVCHPLTVTGGIVTVKNGDKDVTDTLTVTTDETTGKKTYSVPDGAEVTVTLDKTLIPEGMVFDIWSTGKFSLPQGQDYKAESITFTMNTMSSDADIAAQYRDATIEDDGPNVLGTAAIIGTAAVGGAVLGYQAYSLGTEFAGKLMALPYFPSNRSALAMMLWEDAGKPMPESELLYPDVEQEEQDMDLQHAARWAMENELIPDLNDEGTAPEEMKFFPANPVSKLDVLNAWQKAQELKNN
ncbi:leucine-rich repeat protein [Faecalibacterium prausnitzii]|uniref:Bacterial repeat domain-containing protein n=1 Tax=Faecalibacterium prausnitzii TaxID=853 RepID=A0A3E2T785_9FIRM|nr:leucine-rich repeat protein [Faecalibacterium prausnitzii]RGB70126.1 hypothetical protein DWZ89_11235 [Faecalibacterium prausnitzii]RGC04540.1 hypothetical protein DW905_11060 [Faecalibacterium prausnitzii]RGC32529.1 hypothetical protein DW882_09210 [Faecalibacterium prausnitzii]